MGSLDGCHTETFWENMRKEQNISWRDHATLERIYGVLMPLSLDSSKSVFSLLVFLARGWNSRDPRAEADPIGIHDGQKWVFFLPHGSLETHRWLWNIPNETKLGRNIVKESPHVSMVVLYFWLTAWRHKLRWNMALKFGINYLI